MEQDVLARARQFWRFDDKNRIIPPLAIALVASCFIYAGTNTIRQAPELAFNLPGQGRVLLSQYQGKVVALEFIYTTCRHCQTGAKLMSKLQQEYGSRGLQVIDIATNPNADLLVKDFAKSFQVNFPVGWTTSEQMQAFMGFSNGRYVVPQLVLIDRKGYIHYQTPPLSGDEWAKSMTEETIHQQIEELLALKN
jgi:peroxiredoxin